MKRIISFALALIMLLSLTIPAIATCITYQDGVYTAMSNDWFPYKEGITSKHYKISGDFYDKNNGSNGCCGFSFCQNNDAAKGIAFVLSGAGKFGYAAWNNWWGPNFAYTLTEDRFAHIEVEVQVLEDDVIFKAKCNDRTLSDVSIKTLITSGDTSGKDYSGQSVFTPNTIQLWEKIKDGTVKNVTFTDLDLYENSEGWIASDGVYTSPVHTGGNNFEYYILGQGNNVSVSHKYVKGNTAQAGVLLGILDVNNDGVIKESEDRYYYVCANKEGNWVGIERNDCAWGNFAASKGGLTINDGDSIAYNYAYSTKTVTNNDVTTTTYTVTIKVIINGIQVLQYTDNDAEYMTGRQYGYCAKGKVDFVTSSDFLNKNADWQINGNAYTSPAHTHGNFFEYLQIDDDYQSTVNYIFRDSDIASQPGVMFAIDDCNKDGYITEDGDQYYYVTIAKRGENRVVLMEKNNCKWGGWFGGENYAVNIKDGDLLTYTYDKSTNVIEVFVNGVSARKITDNNGAQLTGTGCGLCAKGVAEFRIPAPEFKTTSLVLSGKIGVNFFVAFPDNIDNYYIPETYVNFTVNGETTKVGIDEDFRNEDGYYGFTCYVNSIQMAETITAELNCNSYFSGMFVAETLEYSVKNYVESFMANTAGQSQETVDLVKALADYGHFVQPFLSDYNGWAIGTDYQEMDVYYAEGDYDYASIKTAAADYKAEITPSDEIDNIKYTLSFDSGTDIFIKFKPVSDYTGDVTFKVNGTAAEAEARTDGSYVLKITGISAHKLGDTYTVTAETDNGTATVKVSAMSYVYTILNAYEGNATYTNAVCAFYNYYKAAKALINAD